MPLTQDMARNEVNTLRKLDHPNIEKLCEVFESADNFRVACEVCYGRSSITEETLKDRLVGKKNSRVDFREALEMVYRVLRGLEYLHSKGIAHLNLHLDTIRFKDADYSFECVITDLGYSSYFESLKKESKPTGVYGFIAPELIRGEPAGPGADIFSLGVILFTW